MMQTPKIPDLHHKAVAQAHENRLRLEGELAEQAGAVELAEAEHQAALAGDRDALAKAMREGRPDPKPSAGKAQDGVLDAKRRHEALRQAVEEAGEAEAEVVEANMAELKAAAGKRVEATRAKFLRALEALEAAHSELAIEETVAGWLNRWPDGKGIVGARYVTDLPATPNGDPLTTDAVLNALRKRGLPPEPHRPLGALRAARHEPGGVVVPSEPMIESLTSERSA